MTKAKSNVMTDFGAPIIVLVLICAIMSGLLAATNNVTSPIIAEAERKANEAARIEVMPQADSFEEVTVDGLPDSVTGVFKAANGAGYTFSLTTQGYGGKNTLKMTVGIDMEGKITDTKVLSHSETAGLGSKITTDAFRGQFPGKDANLDGVDNITGATFSSNYYRAAIADAYTAYGLVNG
ncbi:MAG: FMN-binding protein [Oscillospiraceae bacterium]|nr:FMN-binding protein [Oscillospiraceae bacterium]